MQTEIAEKNKFISHKSNATKEEKQATIKEYQTLEQNAGRIEKRTAYTCHNLELPIQIGNSRIFFMEVLHQGQILDSYSPPELTLF